MKNEYHPDRSLGDWLYYIWIWCYCRTVVRVLLWFDHLKEKE